MATETLRADSVLSAGVLANSTNALGAPDGTFTTNTGNTSWTARFAIADPVGLTPNGVHTVTVVARKVPGQSGTPQVDSISLYAAGSLIQTNTLNTGVTSTSGQNVITTFSSALLSGHSLTDIEIEIATTAAGGSGSARTPVQIDSITWSGDFTTPAPSGSASGSFTFTGAASGVTDKQGAASGTFAFSGAADGITDRAGSASGAFAFTGAATGHHPANKGSASGTYTFTGEADGTSVHSGSAEGAFSFTGSADGSTPVSLNQGSAEGTFAFTGGASGSKPRIFFSPPTHEEPIRVQTPPLNYYRLTYASSIVRINGVLTQMRTPSAELVRAAGEEGVDFFRGGYEYFVDDDTYLELQEAGLT